MSEPYWVALAGGGVDYKGDWASATAYKSGDVVRRNGVEYLAVNPSTGAIPPLAPSAAGVELAYAETATSITITTGTSEGTAQVFLTAPAITVDGATPILIEFFSEGIRTAGTANHAVHCWLYDGSTSLGVITFHQTPAAGTLSATAYGRRRLTPSAGSHVYSIRAMGAGGQILAGTGLAGGDAPAFIRISTSQPIRMGVAIPPTYGTSLPSSPLDGQEAVLVDSLTAPTYVWRFRYCAEITDAYKWVFIGGAAKFLSNPGITGTPAGDTIISGLSVPGGAPRSGIWHCEVGAGIAYSSTAAQVVYLKLFVNGVFIVQSYRHVITYTNEAGPLFVQSDTVAASGVGIDARWAVSGGTGGLSPVYLSITPVRVA